MPFQPKIKTITVRFKKDEYEKLEALASNDSLKISTFIYLKILKTIKGIQ